MNLIEEIDAEILRLQHARALLDESPVKRGPGRPRKSVVSTVKAKVQGKRLMSPEGRARIAEAQKKRWAAKRKASRKSAVGN
nr:hypothetical protein [Granulicella sibirica]